MGGGSKDGQRRGPGARRIRPPPGRPFFSFPFKYSLLGLHCPYAFPRHPSMKRLHKAKLRSCRLGPVMPPQDLINACLPDELLLHVFSSLPWLGAWVLDGAVTLGTLGAAERTCHRWRRLALGLATQHPVCLWCDEDTCGFSNWSPAAAGELSHCLDMRRPAVVSVHSPFDTVAELLRGLHLPAVRRLTIQGCDPGAALLLSLPHTFPALEELHTLGGGGEGLRAYQMAYPAVLRLLPGLKAIDIRVPAVTSDLAAALLALPQLQSVRLSLEGPLPASTVVRQQLVQLRPRLRHVSLRLDSLGERAPPELFELTAMVELSINVQTGGGDWEGLQRLSSLGRLNLYTSEPHYPAVPSSCWACSHLTALRLENLCGDVPAGTSAALSMLRRLEMSNVAFLEGDLLAKPCLLPQLTALKLEAMECGDLRGPAGLSKLSNLQLRELSIINFYPDYLDDLLWLRSLASLTHLHLEGYFENIGSHVSGVSGTDHHLGL